MVAVRHALRAHLWPRQRLRQGRCWRARTSEHSSRGRRWVTIGNGLIEQKISGSLPKADCRRPSSRRGRAVVQDDQTAGDVATRYDKLAANWAHRHRTASMRLWLRVHGSTADHRAGRAPMLHAIRPMVGPVCPLRCLPIIGAAPSSSGRVKPGPSSPMWLKGGSSHETLSVCCACGHRIDHLDLWSLCAVRDLAFEQHTGASRHEGFAFGGARCLDRARPRQYATDAASIALHLQRNHHSIRLFDSAGITGQPGTGAGCLDGARAEPHQYGHGHRAA